MADDDLGPEGFGTRGIPSARRGYDKRVVDTLVAEAAQRWAELKRRYDELSTAVEQAGGREHLSRNLAAVGEEVARILTAAGDAATGMRERAAADAAEVVRDAEALADRMRRDADDDAFVARKDAWETGTALLDLVRETAAAIITEAEGGAMLIRAEAEKEAHRRLAITRKEQDDILRSARYELDRQIAQARDLAAEMLSTASEDTHELLPTPTQDERRRELLDEIERIRAARSIDQVSVLPLQQPLLRREGVHFGELDPKAPELSDALAAEVQSLTDAPPPAPREEPPPARRREPSPAPFADDVGTLFEALRTTSEVDVLEPDGDTDPMVLHDRLVLPAHNLGLRELKRRIVDLQNIALDGLRAAGWSPDAALIAGDVTPALEPALQKAAAAGLEAARTLAGVRVDKPAGSPRVKRLIATMASDLASQLRTAAGGEAGREETVATVGRVFRAWRTDEAERWVRALVDAAYHDELLGALAGSGFEVVGIAPGAVCAECPAAAGVAWDPSGVPPDGVRVPPAHLGCVCTIGPA